MLRSSFGAIEEKQPLALAPQAVAPPLMGVAELEQETGGPKAEGRHLHKHKVYNHCSLLNFIKLV